MVGLSVLVGRVPLVTARTLSDALGMTDLVNSVLTPGGGTGFTLTESWFQANTGCRIPDGSLVNHGGGGLATGTYTGRRFTDTVYPTGPNVILRDCVFQGQYFGIDTEARSADGLTIEYCDFRTGENCGMLLIHTGSATVRYCDISGGEDGIKTANAGKLFEYNYIHNLYQDQNDPHNDGIQVFSSTGLTIQKNWISAIDTSCIAMFQGQGTYTDVLIQGNYMSGTGYLVYGGGSSGTNIQIKDNALGTWVYGPVTDWPAGGTSVWSGNYRFSDGTPVNP